MVLALAGAGLTALGSIGNTYGQGQALEAMRRMWATGKREQAGYDSQVQAKTDQLLHDLGLATQLGGPQAAAMTGALDRGTMNAAGAVQRQAARRPGAGGAESRAVARQAGGSTLATALKDNRLQAMLAGLMQGGQKSAQLGQQYGLDTGFIRDDARAAAGLMGQREGLASQQGAWARQLGSMFNTVGQGAMMYGMSQPGSANNGGAIPSAGGAQAQAPTGGWAASKTYHNSDGSTGAWS